MPLYDTHPILGSKPPLTYRLSHRLSQSRVLGFLSSKVAGFARDRDVFNWECVYSWDEEAELCEVMFAAPRILTRLIVHFLPKPVSRQILIEICIGGTWTKLKFDSIWTQIEDGISLSVKLQHLSVVEKVRIHAKAVEDGTIKIWPRIAKHSYRDVEHVVVADQLMVNEDYSAARAHLLDCLELEPRHYVASQMLGQIALNTDNLISARTWAARSYAHSRGEYSGDILFEACKKDISNLIESTNMIKQEANDWKVGGHFGSVCLLNEKTFWLGFDRLHLYKGKQLIEVRRQASARMMRHLQFEFDAERETIIHVNLRILSSDGRVSEVSDENLVIADHPDRNPSIRLQNHRIGLFHLPELHRGDCLELVYFSIFRHPSRPDGLADFFILADMNCSFPTWSSTVTINTPQDWSVKCMGLNGAAEPEVSDVEDGFRAHKVRAERIFFDEWGTSPVERKYRSPHVCCSWDGRTWSDIAELGKKEFCHVIREDTLPVPILDAANNGQAKNEQLQLGFEWIRDHLKYMSLESAKNRTNDPDLANKIVAAGVADCMDRAYLIMLLCKHLDIESEYVVTAASDEFIVENMPAQQFDHILVRAKFNGDWIYLDGTSEGTPFGLLPQYLQGLQVLSLGKSPILVTVPEQDPESNQVSISEWLSFAESGSISGNFKIAATGTPARWWDGQWKSATMSVDNPQKVARQILRRQMPTATAHEWHFEQKDALKDRFSLSGRHERRPAFEIGNCYVGMVDWRTELFSNHFMADRNWNGTSIFLLPLKYRIALEVSCPTGFRIETANGPDDFESVFGAVQTELLQEERRIQLTRTLTLKRKFVSEDLSPDIPNFLTAWKSALSFAFIVRSVNS